MTCRTSTRRSASCRIGDRTFACLPFRISLNVTKAACRRFASSRGLPPARERDDLLRRVLHSVCDRKVQTRLAQHSLTFLDVRAFEPDDDRHFDAEVLRCLDDSARYHVAADDAAEDVYVTAA